MKSLANNFTILLLLSIVLSCTDRPKPLADNRLNDYALYDTNGDFHRFSTYNDSKAIVLWVQGNGCPIVRNLVTDFNNVFTDYSPKGFTFFLLNSNTQDDREESKKEADDFKFAAPVLMDNAQLLADELDIKITSEAIILHPTSRKIIYRGPINNRLDYEAQKNEPTERYLRDALDAIVKDQPVQSREEMTRGCTVTRLSKDSEKETLTYVDDIAPILSNHCVQCHNPEGIAPWAMSDYETVKGWSTMVKQVLLSKRMPPWKADPLIGEFQNSFALHDSNVRKIVRWINSGMSRGEGTDLLAGLTFEAEEWQMGQPDKILHFKKEEIPATGLIPYRYQKMPLHFKSDTWLKGVEIKPGNSKVLHHIVLTNSERNQKSPITDRKIRPWTDNYIALAAGADELTVFPDSTGVFIPAGTTLTAQIHYTPTGKPEADMTRIGLYLHDSIPEKELFSLSPSNTTFEIEPYEKNAAFSISDTISRDIHIHFVLPHMHYRGKQIKFSVIKPNGVKETLVSVPDYNFFWQYMYKLKRPYFAPKGSVILVEGVFDNSYQNPFNPDPSKDIEFGIQSTDEMLIGFFNYTLDD